MYVRDFWIRKSMRSTVTGYERAEGAEGLAECADQHRHVVRAQTEVFAGSAPARAHHAESMRVIDDQPRAGRARRAREFGQRRQIAVHAEHAIGDRAAAIRSTRIERFQVLLDA